MAMLHEGNEEKDASTGCAMSGRVVARVLIVVVVGMCIVFSGSKRGDVHKRWQD